MKIPGAVLQGSVKSLGRQDINGPSRVANAEARANMAMAGAVAGVGKAFGDVFTGQARARGELTLDELRSMHTIENTKLQTVMENQRAFTVGHAENPAQVEEYAAKLGLEAGSVMLASDIMEDVMAAQYANTKAQAYEVLEKEGFSNKLKGDYVASMTTQWANGVASAGKVKAVRQQEALVADFDQQLEFAKSAGDINIARGVIEKGVMSGVYTQAEGINMITELPAEIDFQNYSRALGSDNLGQLEDIQDSIWTDSNFMSNEQRTALYSRYEAKIDELVKAHTAQVKATRETNSARLQVNLTDQIMRGGAMAWRDIPINQLEPADALAVMAINRSMLESRADKSDPQTSSLIQGMLLDLAIPSGRELSSKRDAVMSSIVFHLGENNITADDAAKYMNQVNSMEAIPYKSQEYGQAQDTIYTVLVGASKGSLAFLNKESVNRLNALEMEQAMQDAMRAAGPGFDPNQWVSDNMHLYALKAAETTQEKLNKEIAKTVMVTKGDGTIDEKASHENLKKLAKERRYSEDEIIKFEEDLNRLIDLRSRLLAPGE